MTCVKNFSALATQTIVIEKYTNVDDGYGGQVPTWSTEYTVWGILKASTGKEFIESGQRTININYEAIIRYISALQDPILFAKRRLKINNRYFNIQYVQNLKDYKEKHEGKAYQKIVCIEETKEKI